MATKTPAKKPTVQKAAPKKSVAKTPAKKPAVKKSPAATPVVVKPIKEALTKTALLSKLADVTGIEVKSVKKVMTAFEEIMLASLSKKGLGQFTVPGLMKVTTVKVAAKRMPAIKAGTPVRNPSTGNMEPSKGRAAFTKPASVRVKVRPLKKMKDAAA